MDPTAYLLTSTVSVPIFASLPTSTGASRSFSRRHPFRGHVRPLWSCGTLTFLPLDGMGQLILFRGLQGVGAGMVMGLLFTIVGDIFSPSERGRYQGLFAAVWGLASIFRPDTRRLAHGPLVVARLLLGEPAGRGGGGSAIYLEFPHMKPRGSSRRLDWAGFATLIGTVVPLCSRSRGPPSTAGRPLASSLCSRCRR